MARLDRSGRIYARPLLDALGWSAGHRVDIAVVAGVLVVGSTPIGLHTATGRPPAWPRPHAVDDVNSTHCAS
jgi:hypothetical protein